MKEKIKGYLRTMLLINFKIESDERLLLENYKYLLSLKIHNDKIASRVTLTLILLWVTPSIVNFGISYEIIVGLSIVVLLVLSYSALYIQTQIDEELAKTSEALQVARIDGKDGVHAPLIKQLTEAALEAEPETHVS